MVAPVDPVLALSPLWLALRELTTTPGSEATTIRQPELISIEETVAALDTHEARRLDD